jgi:cell division protease FtsH
VTAEDVTRTPAIDGAEAVRELIERCRFSGTRVGWDDIVGHAPAKRELHIVAAQMRRQSVAERLGIRLVAGVLITGPAGSGKTLLAKALGGEVERPVYVIPASEADATLVRRVYEALAEEQCVVVWDEADVLLRSRRHVGDSAGKTVAAFCSALDGVSPITGPITVCLTAEPEYMLDHSALRAGRLTTHITLMPPDRAERRAMWELYTGQVPTAGTIDLDKATDRSVGMTGADIASIVMVALGLSLVDGTDALRQDLLDEAILRRNRVEERPPRRPAQIRRAAIHEAGHAIFAMATWGPDSLASVTVKEAGLEGGRTSLDDAVVEQLDLDCKLIRDRVAWSVAGMVAEELVYGPTATSVGSGSDLREATELLQRLVTQLGGSGTVGPVDTSVLERGDNSDRGSDAMRTMVWADVHNEAIAAMTAALEVLAPRVGQLEAFADLLIAAEDLTLSGADLEQALRGLSEPKA